MSVKHNVCRYEGCPEMEQGNILGEEDAYITCETCRDELGLPPICRWCDSRCPSGYEYCSHACIVAEMQDWQRIACDPEADQPTASMQAIVEMERLSKASWAEDVRKYYDAELAEWRSPATPRRRSKR